MLTGWAPEIACICRIKHESGRTTNLCYREFEIFVLVDEQIDDLRGEELGRKISIYPSGHAESFSCPVNGGQEIFRGELNCLVNLADQAEDVSRELYVSTPSLQVGIEPPVYSVP